MSSSPPVFPVRGLFVTGTDTGVGKTTVSTLILRQLRAAGRKIGAYKPACSGAVSGPDGQPLWEDAVALRTAAGFDGPEDWICPQRFLAPVAPPHAARLERRLVDETLLAGGATRWTGQVELLIVEGAGGWLSPLGEHSLVADVAAQLQYPVVIVARAGLGTISHTLLTIESIRARRLNIAGVILNEPRPDSADLSTPENALQIEQFSQVPVLGRIFFGRPDHFVSAALHSDVDWNALAARQSCDA